MGKLIGQSGADAPRNESRNSLFVKAVLRFSNGSELGEVRVRNISAGGLMAEAPVRAGRGERVEIQLKNIGWVSGKIAWIAESRCGIAFDYPIDPKATHIPVGNKQAEEDLPNYLRKLNDQQHRAANTTKIRPI